MQFFKTRQKKSSLKIRPVLFWKKGHFRHFILHFNRDNFPLNFLAYPTKDSITSSSTDSNVRKSTLKLPFVTLEANHKKCRELKPTIFSSEIHTS